MPIKKIKIDALARVEGEGGLFLQIRDGAVTAAELRIFEPPRFFEAFLRGRSYEEAPDITARICGICPVAYQMSAVHAMEDALGVQVEGPLRALRRLLYCGEWIESHLLHIYLLHAPDFLGYPDAISLARDAPAVVQRGLQIKKAGNAIMTLLGGREIHPINVRVGGFYRVPTRRELAPLREELVLARDLAVASARWVATLDMPAFEREYTFVALRHPTEYPMNAGRLASSTGLEGAASAYEQYFQEVQVPYSTALHATLRGQGAYFVGPLARYALNFDRLSPLAQAIAREVGLGPVCRNPFQSILVRSIEALYALDEAVRIIDAYEPPEIPAIAIRPRAGTGAACTEAPRGLLYHRYVLDDGGLITEAKIVPPTSQNQATIEEDLRVYAAQIAHLPEAQLTLRCEQAIRNYDPCISCSTHFLKLTLDRV